MLRVTILGGGGITRSLLELLAPFGVEATVVNRSGNPVPGAARTVAVSELDSTLSDALVVVLALSLTPETRAIIGAEQFGTMEQTSAVAPLRHSAHRGYADWLVRATIPPALDIDDYIGRVIAVTRSRRPSPQVIRVLHALAADPTRWRYGYDLATEVHLKSGSLYPILIRLADREVLETSWEPGPPGRPPRHLYRLTPTGREYVATLDLARAERSAPRRRLGLSGA